MKLILVRLDWILTKIRNRRYKSLESVCEEFKMSRVWGEALRVYAVGAGRITEEEWKRAFKQPGRPKAVKPRGPYKKRGQAQRVTGELQEAPGEPQQPPQGED